MISVADALARILAMMTPTGLETVPLAEAAGRVLADPSRARRTQPPFASSAMDGYAVRAAEATPGATLRLVGASVAGNRFDGALGPGETVRIFTGAPLPEGADAVLIQEDAEAEGEAVRPTDAPAPGAHIRKAGVDFAAGTVVAAPRRLGPADVALLAAMNVAEVVVRRRPRVALLPTGDELVWPGETPGPDQIVTSNNFGLAALLAAAGAAPDLRPIAHDRRGALAEALAEAAAEADLVVTLGGASVGEHDLVREAVGAASLDFWKVAVRPGKPLMAGRIGGVPMIGLPGNPVSAMVCGLLFARPAVDALLGLPAASPPRERATLTEPLAPNGPREHYMRGVCERGPDGALRARALPDQDSSLLSVLAEADCLIARPIGDPARAAGDPVEIIRLRD